jgi:ribose 1,5-bisphosphokinase PhnN
MLSVIIKMVISGSRMNINYERYRERERERERAIERRLERKALIID